jgi:pimeloyl-ACP methyl ester carboxylesterase
VSPTYLPAVVQTAGQAADHNPHFQCPVVVLQHGSGYDSVAAFDLQFQDYSLVEALAWAGIDSFAVNLLGWGMSDRFTIDDPCSASKTQQQNFLIPNPLSATCAVPWPFHFTNTNVMRDQLNAVIDDVLSRTGVSQVTLHGWSLGGAIVADYVLNGHPEKVKNVIFQAPAWTCTNEVPTPKLCLVNPPNPLPQPGVPMGSLQSRTSALNDPTRGWLPQLTCPGQRDPAILDPVWRAVRASDPLASNWGPTDPQTGAPGGLLRAPSFDAWGWNPDWTDPNNGTFYPGTFPQFTVPALFLSGLSDKTVPTATVEPQYNGIGSSTKVLVEIACASHLLMWETSPSATWQGGPHKILRDAATEWIKSQTYRGATLGTFQVDANGNITGPF